MIEKNLLKEVRNMAIGVFLLSLFMVLIFFLCGYFSVQVILGALLGDAVCVLNFLILAYCVSQAVEKGEDSAKKYISGTYFLRMILVAVSIIIAIKTPRYFNYLATAIPFVFPRIVITVLNFINSRKGDKVERSEDNI